jgi:hypothetical protein
MQGSPSGFARLGRLAEVGFVGFDGDARATDQLAAVLHRFTDSVSGEPGGFHAAVEHALDLAGADSFLAGAHQVDHLQPQIECQVTGLENGTHADSERLFAGIAFAETGPSGFPVQATDALSFATVWTNRAVWPETRFDVFKSGGFGLELRGGKYRSGHGGISYGLNSRLGCISMRELDRLKCIQGLIDKQLKQKAVAERLGLTG